MWRKISPRSQLDCVVLTPPWALCPCCRCRCTCCHHRQAGSSGVLPFLNPTANQWTILLCQSSTAGPGCNSGVAEQGAAWQTYCKQLAFGTQRSLFIVEGSWGKSVPRQFLPLNPLHSLLFFAPVGERELLCYDHLFLRVAPSRTHKGRVHRAQIVYRGSLTQELIWQTSIVIAAWVIRWIHDFITSVFCIRFSLWPMEFTCWFKTLYK